MKRFCSRVHLLPFILLLHTVVAQSGWAQQIDARTPNRTTATQHDRATAAGAIGRAGVRFTQNRGQVIDTRGDRRPDILYTAGAGAMRLYFRRDAVSYVFRRWAPDESSTTRSRFTPASTLSDVAPIDRGLPSGALTTYRLDMELIGSNPAAGVIAEEPAGSYSNFYLPHAPDGITHVESYHRLVYHDIYPHIDLIFHGGGHGVKYDFIVHPGGRASDIRWRYVGADRVAIDGDGALHVPSVLGEIIEDAPYAYQLGSDREKRAAVACAYRSSDGVYSFAIGPHDEGRALVIDPAVQWSTYLGGAADEIGATYGGGIMAERNGDVIVCGYTESNDYPVSAAMQSTRAGGRDGIVLKISNAGQLLWSTYWGGGSDDRFTGVDGDRNRAGNYAIAGGTASSDFPIGANAYQTARQGPSDMVIGVLDNAGLRKWATYMGGSADDFAQDVVFDSQGNVIVGGTAFSGDFPMRDPRFQFQLNGFSDAVVAKFWTSGLLHWATYYGGSGSEQCTGIAIDINDDIVAVGLTNSPDLPLFGTTFQRTRAGSQNDGFILKLAAADQTPRWSTYYGGSKSTRIDAVAIDGGSSVIVGGQTDSPNLPVSPTSFQRVYVGPALDGFVAKFDRGGAHRWSTYCGSPGVDVVYGVAIGSNDHIFAVGTTTPMNFPVTPNAYQSTPKGASDGFVMQFSPAGAQVYGTLYGGGTTDGSIGADFASGALYMVGYTNSNDLPGTANGFQPQYAAAVDGFVAKLNGFCMLPLPTINTVGLLIVCEGDSLVLDAGAGYASYRWSPSGESTRRIVVRRPGTYFVTVGDGTGCTVASAPAEIRSARKPVPVIAPAGTITICAGDSVRLNARQNGIVSYRWSNGDSVDAIWAKEPGAYSVRVTDTNGCEGISSLVTLRVNPMPVRPQLSPLDTIRVCSDSTLRLDAGAGYASYRWSGTGTNLRSIVATQPGLYYVDVINAEGCAVRSDSVVVIRYPRIAATLLVNGATTFCAGDSLVLRFLPGAFTDPRWSNNVAGDSLVVKTGGLYWVTVLDSNGCRSRSDSVRVTVRPTPSAAITGPATVCASTRPTYSTPATGTVKYAWSISGDGSIQGSSDVQSITVLWGATGGGRLTLRVTDTVNGCSAESTRDVVIGTELKPVVTPSGSITICAGDSVELDAGAGYTTYIWSNGARSQTIWVKDSAGYSVEVADASGCHGRSDTIRARVEALPQPVIDGAVKVCQSSTASYTTSAIGGATYLWTITNGVISGGQGTSSVTVQWGTGPAGVVEVRVTSASGCIGDAVPVNVEIGTELQPVIAANGSLTLCAGDSVELDAGAGYVSYAWSTGATSQRIMVKQSGSFSVTVSDATGCSGSSGVVQVTVNQPPVASITPAGPIALRAGDSIELDAGAGYTSYRWSTGATTQRTIARVSGSYSVTVTDANGCTATASVRIDTVALASAELALGAAEGEPGQRVDVPLLLVASNNLAATGARSYSARVRYRASMLEPTGATPRGVLDGDDRVLTVTGDLPAGMTTGELLRLAFIAAMGDTEAIAMRLEDVTWRNIAGADLNVVDSLHDGSFALIGLCTNGATRLVRAGGATALRVVRATSDAVEIEYEVIETGMVDLSLYDILGRHLLTMESSDPSPESRSVRCDVTDLPSGLYLLILHTPTARLSVPVRIIR